MRKRLILAGCTMTVVAGLFAGTASASPPERAEDPFVCPVLHLSENAVAATGGAGAKFNQIGEGEYTFGPGAAGESLNGNVPNHATNGDGSGSPGGAHSGPGDTDYTAIWSGN
jgi:hypothetical protein